MYSIGINFVQRRHPTSLLGLWLFAVGVVAVGAVAADYLEARKELEFVEMRQARLQTGPRQRQDTPRATQDDEKAVVRAVAQLRTPWDAVLREIEKLGSPAVALLSVDGQGQSHTLRITGEAKAMTDVVAYVRRLRQSPLIEAANLSHHEERQAGAVNVIRFSLDASWRVKP
jgi:Tfp pilus assembly protein PilN